MPENVEILVGVRYQVSGFSLIIRNPFIAEFKPGSKFLKKRAGVSCPLFIKSSIYWKSAAFAAVTFT